jgi:hypothetical protein
VLLSNVAALVQIAIDEPGTPLAEAKVVCRHWRKYTWLENIN